MFGRKRFGHVKSRAQSARLSRDISQSTIGTHASGASHVGSAKKTLRPSHARLTSKNAAHIDVLLPKSASKQARHAAHISHSQENLAVKSIRKQRRGQVIVGLLLAILVLVGAGGTGVWFYLGQLNQSIQIKDENLLASLVRPDSDQVEYTLVCGLHHDPDKKEPQADGILLVGADYTKHKLLVIDIPAQLRLKNANNQDEPLSSLVNDKGGKTFVEGVNRLLGIKIAHLVSLDDKAFVSFIDRVGGVEVNLPEEVDDPRTSSVYIPAGTKRLDGQEALTLSRARNYDKPFDKRLDAQILLLQGIANQGAQGGLGSATGILGGLAGMVKTDMDAGQVARLVDFACSKDTQIEFKSLPGYFVIHGEDDVAYGFAKSAWDNLVLSFFKGADMNSSLASEAAQTQPSQELDAGSFSITLRNGSGITGAAAETEKALSEAGFKVKNDGNTDSAVYDETLVVYRDPKYKDAAQTLVNKLGFGRITDQAVYYRFGGDVLLVIGRDFRPLH